jgi:homoserine O-succinyltransferase
LTDAFAPAASTAAGLDGRTRRVTSFSESQAPFDGGTLAAGLQIMSRPSSGASGHNAARALQIGLFNNMPDAALDSAEAQFRSMLAATGRSIELQLFSLPGIVRGAAARNHLALHYRPWDELWRAPLDAIVVTGTEPAAGDMRGAPYWHELTELLDWAEENAIPAWLSCLASHAAVLHTDGIARQPLPAKCSGVFAERVRVAHPILRDMPACGTDPEGCLRVPHSRWNGLAEADLSACGYTVATASAAAGVGLFLRQRRSLVVHVQGHPEYAARTLQREYRRDVGRYLAGTYDRYPDLPAGYFTPTTEALLMAFRTLAMDDRDPSLMQRFPGQLDLLDPAAGWRPTAARIWRNWIEFVCRP